MRVTDPSDPRISETLRSALPQITEREVQQRLTAESFLVTVESGATVIAPRDPIRAIPVVVEGTVKVSREDENGRELLLYYIKPGESCALTLVSFLCQQHSGIRAVALTNVTALMIPVSTADTLMKRSPTWQEFTYRQVRRSYDLLLQTIDDVAFHSLEDRLHEWLQKQRELHGPVLKVTHQEIATDLSTSREVVSRLLKNAEREGLVALGRNTIEVLTRSRDQ
jgi:CRP/FNR family transcriptional regulator